MSPLARYDIRRYLTCQTCGDYFRTKAGATAHLLTHPGHKVR